MPVASRERGGIQVNMLVKSAILFALAGAALLMASPNASAQIIAQPTAADYCADQSPARQRQSGPARTFVNITVQGAGTVSARMFGTRANCIRTQPAVCPPNCRLEVQRLCEWHCSHNHIGPYAWFVELMPAPAAGQHFRGWSGAACLPRVNVARTSCVVHMTQDRSVTAMFGEEADTSPPAPFTLSPGQGGSYAFTLNWTPSGDETWFGGYDVYRDGHFHVARLAPGATSHRVPNLLCNTEYTFRVEAFDAANATASNVITVRTGSCQVARPAPRIEMHVKPPRTTKQRRARFHWGVRPINGIRPRVTYQCKLNKRAWQACRPGKTYRNLKKGVHTFRVRARDVQTRRLGPAYVWRWRIR